MTCHDIQLVLIRQARRYSVRGIVESADADRMRPYDYSARAIPASGKAGPRTTE